MGVNPQIGLQGISGYFGLRAQGTQGVSGWTDSSDIHDNIFYKENEKRKSLCKMIAEWGHPMGTLREKEVIAKAFLEKFSTPELESVLEIPAHKMHEMLMRVTEKTVAKDSTDVHEPPEEDNDKPLFEKESYGKWNPGGNS